MRLARAPEREEGNGRKEEKEGRGGKKEKKLDTVPFVDGTVAANLFIGM